MRGKLADLNKEALQAQREEQRNAITENIDKQIEDNTKKLKDDTSNIYTVLKELAKKDGIPEDLFTKLEKTSPQGENGLTGTEQHSEATLSTDQIELIRNFMSTLQESQSVSGLGTYSIDGTSSNVVIEKIEIKPNQLNDNQDWQEAAGLFAETFNNIIRRGGLNVNVKK